MGNKNFQSKNAGDPQDTAPEVVAAITKEITALGDNVKQNYDDMNKRFGEIKSEIDRCSDDVLSKEKIIKLGEDISTRQKALDEKNEEIKQAVDKRIDAVESALNRLPAVIAGSKDVQEINREAKDFMTHCFAVRAKDEKGASYDRMKDLVVDVEAYKKYQDAFETFLRKDDRLVDIGEFKALQVGIDPDGGFTVPPAMSARIIAKVYEVDPIRALASIEKISTGAIEMEVDWTEPTGGWESETVQGAETDTPTFKKKRISTHFQYARNKVTQTLIEDSAINIVNWLSTRVGAKLGRLEEAAFVSGSGIDKPRGFLTYGDGTTIGTIERTASTLAAGFKADDFITIKYKFKEYYLERGTFLMQRATMAEVVKLKYGDGQYIWRPGFQTDSGSTILNLPVRMAPSMPALASGALSVALADWKEAYLVVDRLGITTQRDPYTVKPFVEFYTRRRVGGDVTNYEAIKIMAIL